MNRRIFIYHEMLCNLLFRGLAIMALLLDIVEENDCVSIKKRSTWVRDILNNFSIYSVF